jgi:hypothetical protein
LAVGGRRQARIGRNEAGAAPGAETRAWLSGPVALRADQRRRGCGHLGFLNATECGSENERRINLLKRVETELKK